MSEVSKLKFENGTYDLKDTQARNEINNLESEVNNLDQKVESNTNHLDQIIEQTINVKMPPTPFEPIIGDGVTDELNTFQDLYDYAKSVKKTLVIPPNTNIILNGDFWLTDDTTIMGFGNSSQLTFTEGSLRAEKGGKRSFPKTTAYYNDYVPSDAGDYSVTLTADVPIGSYNLPVNNATDVNVGDILYTFNNNMDAWAILEDYVNQSDKFNDHENYPLAQMEIFTVLDKTATSIKLDRQTLFNLPSGSPVKKLLGAKNVKLSNFQINFTGGQSQGVLLEQVRDSTFEDLTLIGAGFDLHNKCFRNRIINCHIHTKTTRAISLVSFSSGNIVTNNTVQYSHGGDTAILVMMSSSNVISNNFVNGSGLQTSDEGGINIHARSYGNTVTGNTVKGASVSYALYYGAWNNEIVGNTSISALTHIGCHYASKNNISNISCFGKNRDVVGSGSVERGFLTFHSKDVTIKNCSFEMECYIEHSKRISFVNNRVTTPADVGIHIIGENKEAEHIITGNRFISRIGLNITTGLYFDWEGALPTRIQNNIFNCSEIGIKLKWLMYVVIKDNTFKNCTTGIFNDNTGMGVVQNNDFIDCTKGVDFNNQLASSCCSALGNTFKNVPTPYNSFQFNDATLYQAVGGTYGFTVYDIRTLVNPPRWVYNNLTSGETGVTNWTKITLVTE